MEFNFAGFILGATTFFIIGFFHPIVIKAEYHFGKSVWPVFLIIGITVLDDIPFPVEVKQNNNNLYWNGWKWYQELAENAL